MAVADTPTGALSGAAKASKNLSLVAGHNLKTYVHNNIVIILLYTQQMQYASYSTVGVHCEHY